MNIHKYKKSKKGMRFMLNEEIKKKKENKNYSEAKINRLKKAIIKCSEKIKELKKNKESAK